MNKSKLEFSSHSGNLALMRKYVRKFLDTYQFSQKERTLMVLGVDEACTNIIRPLGSCRASSLLPRLNGRDADSVPYRSKMDNRASGA